MRQLIFLLLFIFSIGRVQASADFFTPSSEVFETEQDALWDFAVEKSLATKKFPDLVTEIAGQKEEFVFNNLENPSYLVRSKLDLDLLLPSQQELWLEFELKIETQESLRGFDDPAMVIYLDNDLIWKRSAQDLCPSGKCDWGKQTIYLGKVQKDDHKLSIYAGETGDLEQPTQVTIKNLAVVVAAKPLPVQLNPAIPDLIDKIDAAITKVVASSEEKAGQLLGTIKEKETSFVSKSWFFVIVWLAMTLIIIGVWGVINKVASRKGANYEKNK